MTPSKRSGGFFIGNIASSTFGTTGNKAITGIGFKPKFVRFTVLYSSVSTVDGIAFGAMTTSSQYYCSSSSLTGTFARTSSTSACIGWLSGSSTVQMLASYVSMDTDGFTINVTTANNALPIEFEAYA